MTKDEFAQKLALLPEGLAEENLRTWQESIQYYQEAIQLDQVIVSDQSISAFRHLLDLVLTISKSGQEKLFRVYASIWMLITSTSTSERVGEGQGIPFIVVDLKNDDLFFVGYYEHKTSWEITECMGNEIAPTLQPLLDRLWNETRGKENA